LLPSLGGGGLLLSLCGGGVVTMLLTCGSLLVRIPLTGAGICMFWSRLVCFHGFIDKSVIQLWISPQGRAPAVRPHVGGVHADDMRRGL
jgi:hypothetical protein